MMHEVYLPFSEEEQLRRHFVDVKQNGKYPEKHLEYYKKALKGIKNIMLRLRIEKGILFLI